MTKLLNGREAFYLKETGWNRTFILSMMKPLGLGYQNIDMCPNFCMLYYLENAELTECMTCGHSRYIPRTGRGKTLVAYKKFKSQSHLDCRGYSCHQELMNTWHVTNHMMRLMEWWCIDKIKRLMSSPKCRSVEVINKPSRPGSNHMEVNCIKL